MREYTLRNYGFILEMRGAGGAIPAQDPRYLKFYRSDGQLIDCALNLLIERWSQGLLDYNPGPQTRQPLADVATYVKHNDRLLRLDVLAKYNVEEELRVGKVRLIKMRGFLNQKSGVTATRGFTIEIPNLEALADDWEVVASLDKLAAQPILILKRHVCPRRIVLPPD